jgi:gamma-butyrobetaine dioxygenase
MTAAAHLDPSQDFNNRSDPDTLPWTPDFESYPVAHCIASVTHDRHSVRITWDDDRVSEYDRHLLRENSPDDTTIHPLSREMLISPLDIPDDLDIDSAGIDKHGALQIKWRQESLTSHYHPGWLYAHGWFEPASSASSALTVTTLWDAQNLSQPPSFDGHSVLEDEAAMLEWLEAFHQFGIARLRGLPNRDGLLEQIVTGIGPLRESSFGRIYTLEIKEVPDSNAYTSHELPQHIDLPTRINPPDLQYLFCRANTTSGGEGVYVDGYRVAEALREQHPQDFDILCNTCWEFKNRSETYDYRVRQPVISVDESGAVCDIRINSWLRAPLVAPLQQQQRAYNAFRRLTHIAQDPAMQLVFRYEAGDLLAFCNRRILHGRRAYDAQGGERFIEGVYQDRDELNSRIRILRRNLKA